MKNYTDTVNLEENKKVNELDIVVPIELNPENGTCDEIADVILYQHKKFGIKRFAFFAMSKGWRSIGYPPREEYIRCAEMGAEVQRLVADYDIEIGWFLALTLKSGFSDEFTSPVKEDGSIHAFSSCPLDPNFRKRFAEDIALFCKIAKPAFIFTEDDYSICAVDGCFCEHHLNEFAKRMGKFYSREELVEIFSQKTSESYNILRKWRELARDSLVEFAKHLRKELDKESPEIPLGYMQSGGADYDGDVTEIVSRAMAGEKHIPYSRLFGTFYCGVDIKRIPEELYHPLYSKQHIGDNFKFYHESDAYPHNKFYTAGKHMKSMMGTVFSYGFDGSIYFTGGLDFSQASAEPVYGQLHSKEIRRFNEVYRLSKQCTLKGVEINYDPFWNTADNSLSTINPLWVRSISRFGIPYISLDSQVAFWDVRQAKYSDHETIMDRLSKGLFLDGDAAKCLCERGYGKYLGVEMGDDVIAGTPLVFDLGAQEVVCEKYASEFKCGKMPAAHMFCPPGNGKWLKMDVIDKKCEVVTEAHTFQDKLITPTMTRFKNELGGRVVVMSLTLDGNNSQALFNYDRQRIIQDLLSWCSDEYIYVKESPDVFVVVNEANDKNNDFIGFLTMINLCEDELDSVELHMPENWKKAEKIYVLNQSGEWQEVSYENRDNSMVIMTEFACCEPVYIKMEK